MTHYHHHRQILIVHIYEQLASIPTNAFVKGRCWRISDPFYGDGSVFITNILPLIVRTQFDKETS